MARRPLCIVCLILILSLCIADRAGIPLIRGNPVPENVVSWIEKHPDVKICGEVAQTTENEFSQSVYLSNTYLIYRSKKISIENVKAYLKKKEEVPIGTVVLMSGNLQRVEEKRNPGEFDSQQYYACQHIYYCLKKGEILEKSKSYSVYRQFLCGLRKYFAKILGKIAGEQAGIFQAIVLGDKSGLEDTVKLRYQMAGIVHILAISGLHISVIGTGLYQLLMKTGMGIWPSGLIALVVMLQYGIMTGGSVSTMRAVTMFLITAGAKITGRIYDLPTALAVSAMMILGESGAYLYSSGFLLSFSAVFGAGIVVPVLERNRKGRSWKNKKQEMGRRKTGNLERIKLKCAKIRRLKNQDGTKKLEMIFEKICQMLIVSIGVQLVMLPVSFYFFGEVSLAGIFLNLIVLPTVGIVLGSGVMGLLLGCVNLEIARIFILPGRILAGVYEKLCEMSGNLPFATWIAGQPRVWQIIVYYLLLGSAGGLYIYGEKMVEMVRGKFCRQEIMTYEASGQKTNRYRAPIGVGSIVTKWHFRICSVFLLLGVGFFALIWRPPGDFSITCLDVGQGDCIIVETPGKNCFLVDGGSTNKGKTGQYQILPYLKSKGISKVDGILISHTDQDHISGIQEILELTEQKLNPVKIACLYLPSWKNPPQAWIKLKETAWRAGIPVRSLGEGERLTVGSLKMDILTPSVNATGEDVNEDCMVVQIQYGKFRGLLTGDMGAETEKELLKREALKDVDFLKVGHHGSHYSTCEEFLEKVKPEYGIISCSATNTYGHPAAEIVERLENVGCQVGFTMKSGAVTVHTDGQKVWMEGYVERNELVDTSGRF